MKSRSKTNLGIYFGSSSTMILVFLFSLSTSFSLYPHLFEYIHIPHNYIHIFSSISTSVVAILESLLRLKRMVTGCPHKNIPSVMFLAQSICLKNIHRRFQYDKLQNWPLFSSTRKWNISMYLFQLNSIIKSQTVSSSSNGQV